MNRIDIVVDLETLGTNNSPVIMQIGAAVFDITTGKIIRKFSHNISIQSCINLGLNIDALTLKWWTKQDPNTIKEVMNGTKSLEFVLDEFKKWVMMVSGNAIGIVHLWGNGILADNTWLKSAYNLIGKTYPIHYTKDRDVRTILDLAAIKLDVTEKQIQSQVENKGVYHNAVDDAEWAAKVVSTCYNILLQ